MDKIASFIKLNFYSAVKCWRATNIPVVFTLAQAGLESKWGDKAPGFNYFGVKAGGSWKGKKQLLPTTEDLTSADRSKYQFPVVDRIVPFKRDGKQLYKWYIEDWFRSYDTADEGFKDHGNVLLLPRYKAAFAHTDPKDFADAVAAAGYATGVGYNKVLKDCIDSVLRRLPELGLTIPTS